MSLPSCFSGVRSILSDLFWTYYESDECLAFFSYPYFHIRHFFLIHPIFLSPFLCVDHIFYFYLFWWYSLQKKNIKRILHSRLITVLQLYAALTVKTVELVSDRILVHVEMDMKEKFVVEVCIHIFLWNIWTLC